jgi:hypothetical protein
MKIDLTTGTWQDNPRCPINITLVSTSDGLASPRSYMEQLSIQNTSCGWKQNEGALPPCIFNTCQCAKFKFCGRGGEGRGILLCSCRITELVCRTLGNLSASFCLAKVAHMIACMVAPLYGSSGIVHSPDDVWLSLTWLTWLNFHLRGNSIAVFLRLTQLVRGN